MNLIRLICCMVFLGSFNFAAYAAPPEVPRIDSVVISPSQPIEDDPAVIWYDDFDGPPKNYTESQGGLDDAEVFGGSGRSMHSFYEKGSRGVGNRKVFFGDSPTGRVVKKGQQYTDVYWRIYVKHQEGWQGGGPAKLSRATSIVSSNWAQAMIAHVWSSGEALTLDPASGVQGSQVVTTRYNDFPNLDWLGNRPVSPFKLHSTEESGRWVCVEARAKLNTPGKKDGLNQLWIDGKLQTERKNLDWRGNYTKHGINAVFLETYWNDGSPVTQSRWIDNFVIATKYIGPVVCPRNPTLIRSKLPENNEIDTWQVELASDEHGDDIVWKSNLIKEKVKITVNNQTGEFTGSNKNEISLKPDTQIFGRIRQQSESGEWSVWSDWHQPFYTESETKSNIKINYIN